MLKESVSVQKARFKKMCNRLKTELAERDIKLSHQSALQVLSKVMFGKPYEEAEATVLKMKATGKTDALNKVAVYTLIRYGSEEILLKGDEYVTGNYPGTDLYVNPSYFYDQAEQLSNGELITEQLPRILGDEYETDDVIALAKSLGMLNGHCSIFSAIETAKAIKINGLPCDYKLNGDYLDEAEVEYENDGDPMELCVWTPETYESGKSHEYYFTLENLASASTQDKGKTWHVKMLDTDLSVAIEVLN
jgi:hypothetical protein